jgi:predicted N-acetyltransferase YhbS
MGDLLVRLYDLPDAAPALAKVHEAGITIKRPLPSEKSHLCRLIRSHFSEGWSDEVAMTFSSQPPTCLVALDSAGSLVGFACYDAAYRGFFGPAGVLESHRGRGIGTALLRLALASMGEAGYAYAIIGYSGADEFYARTVGAVPIEGSTPGPYHHPLRRG